MYCSHSVSSFNQIRLSLFLPQPSTTQAHSCVEKAGMIGYVKMRHLDVDENLSLRGHVLEDAIEVCVHEQAINTGALISILHSINRLFQ